MKKTLRSLAMVAGLGLASVAASASPINIGGVIWDPSSPFDFESTDTMYEKAVTNVGDALAGFGKIGNINGYGEATFCPGCELTYKFSGYTLISNTGGNFVFSGGTFQVYVDNTPNWNPLLASTATDGTLFLTLAGVTHTDLATSLVGTIISDPTPTGTGAALAGDGRGYLDVVAGGGLATGLFDTNTLAYIDGLGAPGFADLQFTSSFQLLRTPFVSDDGVTYSMFGSNDLQGNTVPEPGSMALLGLGLAGLGLLQRRRNAAK